MDPPELQREGARVAVSWNEVTGAVGDAATVLPVVVAVAALTELSLPVMLGWFGVFQVAWGLHYGAPISVEPMKALAALVLAGTVSVGELAAAGFLVAGTLLALGATRTLSRVQRYVGEPVVRGVQLGVALVLLETGVDLGLGDPGLAVAAATAAGVAVAAGHWRVSGLAAFLVGAAVAVLEVGAPAPALPPASAVLVPPALEVSADAVEGALAQLAMTVGNAALATAVLLGDLFDRDVSADELSASMGATNLVAVPLGGFPMCHGSGGLAGKYAFGARSAGANLVLGAGYLAVAVLGAGLVAAYPMAVLGVVLALVAVQLGRTSIERTDGGVGDYAMVVFVGVLGVLANLGVAFAAGVAVHLARTRYRRRRA